MSQGGDRRPQREATPNSCRDPPTLLSCHLFSLIPRAAAYRIPGTSSSYLALSLCPCLPAAHPPFHASISMVFIPLQSRVMAYLRFATRSPPLILRHCASCGRPPPNSSTCPYLVNTNLLLISLDGALRPRGAKASHSIWALFEQPQLQGTVVDP